MQRELVAVLAVLLFLVSAAPLTKRDVVDPPITSPTANTVWHVGQTQTVTWSTANLPVNQTNPVGMLVLGYLYNNSENLMLNSPLATNLNYSVGQAQITVPNVPTRADYIVVLFGDSGNASPQFTIINDASSSLSATTTIVIPSPPSIPTPASNPSPSAPVDVGATSPSHTTGSGTSPSQESGSKTSDSVTSSSSHTTSSTVTSTVTVTPSTVPASSSQSSAAGQNPAPGLATCFGISLALVLFTFS